MTEHTICDIVIPVWNQPELTQRCLESVERCTTVPVRLILVDNGSEPKTQEALARFRANSRLPTQILHNERNLGFIRASNQGIGAAGSEWVCLLNNDTVVAPGWLSEMIRVAESDPRIGLVNPTSNSLGFRPREKIHWGLTPPGDSSAVPEGVRPLQVLEAYASSLKAESGCWAELPTALGFCLLARRSLFDRIGLLDERYGMGNFDDDDLSRRARSAGLLCVRACGAYVYHEEKASFRELPGWEEEFEKNRRIFESRWGRPLRILWVIPPPGGYPASGPPPCPPPETVRRLVQEGHWITFVSAPGTLPESVLSLAQVHQIPARKTVWRGQALWRLLTKRRKPFERVVSEDPTLSRWVEALHPFHRATCCHRTDPETLIKECQQPPPSR